MRATAWLLLVACSACLATGCARDNRPAQALAVLFDNSGSYKEYIPATLTEVQVLFHRLQIFYPDLPVRLLIVGDKPQEVYYGPASGWLQGYPDLKSTLEQGQARFTDLVAAQTEALEFLAEQNARNQRVIIFGDLKHSTPAYHPGDEPTIPPPPEFPWPVKDGAVKVGVPHWVPEDEWSLWKAEIGARGLEQTFIMFKKGTSVADQWYPE